MKDQKIVVIDDEVDFRFLMKEYFSKKGYQVVVAHSIHEGLQVIQEEKPDFIFLDNNLPDGFGWSKTEFITTNYPTARLILTSSMQVPKTSSSTFSIFYKPLIRDELHKMFG